MKLWDKYKEMDDLRVKKPTCIPDLSEIKAIREDGIFEVGTGRIFTKTYRLSDINYSLLTRNEKINILERWCRFLNTGNLPIKLTIIKNHRNMADFEKEACFSFNDDGYNFIRQSFNDEIKGSIKSNLSTRRIYLTLRADAAPDFSAASAQFKIMEEAVSEQIKALGSNITPLKAYDRLKVLHDVYRSPDEEFLMSQGSPMHSEDFMKGVMPDEVDLESEDMMKFTYDGKEKYAACIYLKDFKTSLPESFLTSIMSLDMEYAVSIDMTPISTEDVKIMFNRKYNALRRLIENQNKHHVDNRDWSSDITRSVADDYENIKGHMDDFNYNKQRYFYTMVNFCIFADSKEQLKKNVESLILTVKNAGHEVSADVSWLYQWESLNTVLPIGVKNVRNGRTCQSRALAPFNPFTMQELYNTDGIWYGKNRKSEDMIMLDRRRLLSPHGWLFGETGSGKTAAAALNAMEIFLKYPNADIIILDPKNHFKDFADATNGIYYDISPSSNIRINPFTYFAAGKRGDVAGDKNGILLALTEVCKKEDITAKERTVLGRALDTAYKMGKPEVCLQDIYDALLSVGSSETAEDLRMYLEYFMSGALSIFSSYGNVDINNRVTVYGLQNMGEALRELSMLVIFESIKERVYSNFAAGRATWIFIDEAPEMLKTDTEQAYINSAWMLYRSLGGILTGIAQSITQLTRTDVTKELIENSEFFMILKQQDAAADELADYLGLSLSELDYVFTQSSPGTGLIRYGKTAAPFDMRVSKSSLLYDMINTSFHELHPDE